MALERRGAKIVYAPAHPDRAARRRHRHARRHPSCLAAPPDIVVVTTASASGWMEAADAWGLATPLFEASGHRDRGDARTEGARAVRAAGLTEAWSPESESSSEVLDYLLQMDLTGRRIARSAARRAGARLVQSLCAAGAEIVEVPVYRWVPPEDIGPLHRLIAAVAHAARSTPSRSPARRPRPVSCTPSVTRPMFLEALRSNVLACCVGPVTAIPLQRADVPTVAPDRPRPRRAGPRDLHARCRLDAALTLPVAGHIIDIRVMSSWWTDRSSARHHGDGPAGACSPPPGRVVSRAALLATLPHDGQDEHAVEVAIGRIRVALATPASSTPSSSADTASPTNPNAPAPAPPAPVAPLASAGRPGP